VNEDPLLTEVAEMGALVVTEELAEHGILPLDQLVAIIKASIVTFLTFASYERN
jgi:hypothetical protein